MAVHTGYIHVASNIAGMTIIIWGNLKKSTITSLIVPLVQILLGLPLEIVHGPLRIGAVYVAGVLTGSLARDSTN